MKKRTLITVIAAFSAVLILAVGVSTAYFTEVEVRDNNITIGNVSITLSEGEFVPTTTYPVVPGSVVKKAPKLTNDGTQEEYVFMKILVPTDTVDLLYEETEGGNIRGTKIGGLSGSQQLFKLIADTPSPDTVQSVASAPNKDISFTYHSNEASGTVVDGWVLLKTEYGKTKTENSVTTTWDEYVFGYNKKLAPQDETVTLFDRVQLKSFIDSQPDNKDVTIGVVSYGIQAKNLKPATGENIDLTAAHLNEPTLRAIYTIVENKANQ